jgi:hypothetical protein
VLEEAFHEGLRRDPARQKTWVGLVDGNPTQLDLLETLSRTHKVKVSIVLDVMHVSEVVLRLRALRCSGDFEQYWDYHVAQEYRRNHVARYAQGNVVPVQGHTRAAPRRVK